MIIKTKKVPEYQKLSVFDFDDTLFRSPDKPKNYKKNWWSSKESLDVPNVPEVPGSDFWNMDVVNEAKKEINSPATYTILLTGRLEPVFEERVKNLLRQQKLGFKYVRLNSPGQDTADFKIDEINKILKKFPSIKKIEMWDDDLEKIELYNDKFNQEYSLKINKIG